MQGGFRIALTSTAVGLRPDAPRDSRQLVAEFCFRSGALSPGGALKVILTPSCIFHS
jgi:hypothetical protein